ncbi:MAG: TonB-dependent receptor [Bacteroidetes bacterium]|nr:TonB-dependent receptor [Bacteroidota bacterium]MBS1540349.1 TonB-dependent receptor [Bacteroidota bacterium]
MKAILFLLGTWTTTAGWAQQNEPTLLKPITVYGLPEEKYLTGSSVVPLDSALKAHEHSRSLGEILAYQFPVYFRTYGNGMLAGISMRGTSPQHTAVLWNGININSFSLGQADFSILPAAALDEVKVHEGAGSARYGSGAFGGSVLINSYPSSGKNNLTLAQEAGSFGRYFSSATASYTLNRWSLKTNIYNLSSQNNFPVLATGERQPHAAFRQSGILQDIEYKWSESKMVSLHYWYHNADRDIQPTIGQQNATDNQQDRNHRFSIQYRSYSRYGLLSLTGGYINDVIVYNNNPGGVIRWVSAARHEFVWASFHTQVRAEWNHIIGNIANYQNGHAQEDRYDFTSSIQKNLGERLSLTLNLRQPVVSRFQAPFLPYLGAEFMLLKKARHEIKIRGSLSKNYRVPTLNDRYWQNAGNKNLLPETSHAAEAGINYRLGSLEISNTWFAQKVDDWIQWVPGQAGVYRPQNIEQVLAKGMEVRISSRQKINEVILLPSFSYQFTQSTTTQAPASLQYTLGKQLIYTPQHTATGFVQLVWRKFSSDITAQYNGLRYTDLGNSDAYALPAYVLFNFSMGKFWVSHQHRFDLRVSIKNISNLDYQLYAGRAMPGRHYNLQFTYQLTKSN